MYSLNGICGGDSVIVWRNAGLNCVI